MSASTDDLTHFIATGPAGKNTRRSIYYALRSYYTWATARGVVNDDPTEALRRPPRRMGVPHPVGEDLFTAAMRRAGDRDRLMLLLAGQVGLRRSEIARAEREHLTNIGLTVTFGKGDRARVVRVNSEVRTAIEDCPPGYLFPGRFGGHMHVDAVGKAIRRALGNSASAHDCRHRYATVTYVKTNNLLAIQESMGHSDPATTKGYIQLSGDALQEVADAA